MGELTVASSPYLWKIDPLDGTENFVLGLSYFSSTLTFYYRNQPLVAVVYEPLTASLYTAIRGQGAWLNDKRLHVSQTTQLKGSRVFLIPDFVTKRQPLTVSVRHSLHMHCRRVLDTWSPALDWCLVASGKADLLIAIADTPISPDAGTLILEEAGGRITDFSGKEFVGHNQSCLISSNGTELHSHLFKMIQELSWENEQCSEIALLKPLCGRL